MTENQFIREDVLFSLCGLNCGLCPMYIRKQCGGCFSDSPCYPTCPIAPCSVEHGNVQYCFECSEYPCDKYDGIDEHDSLISHRNQKKDLLKAKRMGIEKYREELKAKMEILDELLTDYDNGRMEVFYCLAVNLLDLDDLKYSMEKIKSETAKMDLNEKSSFVKSQFYSCADKRNIELVLRR